MPRGVSALPLRECHTPAPRIYHVPTTLYRTRAHVLFPSPLKSTPLHVLSAILGAGSHKFLPARIGLRSCSPHLYSSHQEAY